MKEVTGRRDRIKSIVPHIQNYFVNWLWLSKQMFCPKVVGDRLSLAIIIVPTFTKHNPSFLIICCFDFYTHNFICMRCENAIYAGKYDNPNIDLDILFKYYKSFAPERI